MTVAKTFRGRGLDELLARIREELGEDAIIVARREDTEGGVGGFFSRKMIELDARPAGGSLDVVADEYAAPPVDLPRDEAPAVARDDAPAHADDFSSFEEHLQVLLGTGSAAPAQAAEPPPESQSEVPELLGPPAPEPEPAATEPVAAEPVTPELETAAPASALAEPMVELTQENARRAVDALIEAGIGTEVARSVIEETMTHLAPFAPEPSLTPLVQRALAARIPVHVTRGADGLVIGFVGPGGSGKTRCVARLAAAYAARSALPVAVVSLRAKDGGTELRGLLAESGVMVHDAPDAVVAAERIAELRTSAMVVVDTPGVSPRDDEALQALADDLARVDADELHLVIPATIAPRAARELVAGARMLGPSAIAITHQDETDAVGTVVDLAIETPLPLSFVGAGGSALTGLRRADAVELARMLMP